jgi:hypothetical protein
MKPHAQVLDDERVAALIQCMGSPARGESREARLVSSPPGTELASFSAWDTILVVRSEVDYAGRHVLVACQAVIGWVLRDARTFQLPRADRRGCDDVQRPS